MHKSKIKQISLAVCLAFMPLSGYTAGLGKLNVNSGLGEPLRAEVELISVTPEELSTLSAAIASEEAYAVQGITRLGIHSNIRVDIARNADGSPILKLHTSQPISDPYLDMLIQVDWASGRLLREYTVLLDPPEYKQPVNEASLAPASPVATSKAARSSNVSSDAISDGVPQNARKSKKAKKPPQAVVQKDEPAQADETNVLTTKRGDTLNSIAKEMQVEGVSLDQMLIGLFENNKDAFTSGNINRLKVGQIIKAPSKEDLTAIDPEQARKAVKLHSANWNAYRNTLAGTVAAAPVAAESEQKQSASGKIAAAEDKAAPVKAGAQDVVKLSAGNKDAGKGGKEASNDFDAKILALQEEATAREKALKESQQRTAALETQIEDMKKLLALKSKTMADMQKNVEVAAKPVEHVVEAPKPEPVAEIKKTPPVATKAKPHVSQPPVEAQPEPSFLESLFGGLDLTVLGGASAVALLGAGWMFLRNKRRRDLDSFERGILTSGGLRANTVFGNTTGNASTSDTSFLTDFAQSADGSMIDTNDVDPIAEAEVYMAYGRDAQAEEILKDAIVKEPKRYELHLKLLEMYAGRKDISAFEAIAGELYTTLGANDPTWAKVAELGATVEPDNPLYDASKIVASNAVLDASELAGVAAITDAGLDFSLDDEPDATPKVEDASSVVMQSFSSSDNIEQNQSFDLGSVEDALTVDSTKGTASTEESSLETSTVDDDVLSAELSTDNSMDFDLAELESPSSAEIIEDKPVLMNEVLVPEPTLAATEKMDTAVADATDSKVEFGLDFDLPETVASAIPEVALETKPNDVDSKDFNFDAFNNIAAHSADEDAVDGDVEEITFDLPMDEKITLDAAPAVAALDANEFDFSGISLDLGDEDSQALVDSASSDASIEGKPSVAPENQDVDIKLDLVAAYIDMDDKEGARELLDEVLKEGGPQQRLRAEQLLTSLA